MARALGVGGVFFKSSEPETLANWYATWLGFEIDTSFGGTCFRAGDVPPGGYTVWSPFGTDTTYFEPSDRPYMINLMVDDLDGALRQVEEGGAHLVGSPTDDQFGRFGWFMDPEGNKVELWQPPPPAR